MRNAWQKHRSGSRIKRSGVKFMYLLDRIGLYGCWQRFKKHTHYNRMALANIWCSIELVWKSCLVVCWMAWLLVCVFVCACVCMCVKHTFCRCVIVHQWFWMVYLSIHIYLYIKWREKKRDHWILEFILYVRIYTCHTSWESCTKSMNCHDFLIAFVSINPIIRVKRTK